MAEKGDTHYDLKRMNLVFMLTAVALLGCLVWMVLADWNRDWKVHQREFQELEYERAVAEAAAIEESAEFKAQREDLTARIAALQVDLDSDPAYSAAWDAWRAADGDRYRTETELKIAKSVLNWDRYLNNTAKATKVGEVAAAERYAESQATLERVRAESEAAIAEFDRTSAVLAEITKARDEARAGLVTLTRKLAQIETRKLGVQPGVFRTLRNAPGLDFVAPSITVRKQVLPHLRKNYSFVSVQRVDMCASCHVSIDDPNYTHEALVERGIAAEVDAALVAHPRLDLFLSPGSAHPIEAFGCTVCHDGGSETLDFSRAVHTPEDEDEEHRWSEERGWHHWHLWNWPMMPVKYTESGCYSCHQLGGTLESIADDAPKMTEGLQLMEQYGCYSCHQIKGWRIERKPAPALRKIAAKIDRDFAGSWIANPHQFRDGTRMPQVFHLENGVSKEWDDTSIAAVREYLWDRSEQQDVPKMPADLRVAADAARGEALFQQAGCLACHEGAGADGHDYSKFGPDLTGIGSKLSEDWLYQWVYDPQAWWPETRMPNLRLEPQEAADIAVYLSERKAADWTPIAVDHDPALLEEQALAFLQARRTLDESRQTLEQWRTEGGEPRVLAEVGKQWILRQGCYSCHDIPGFEQGMPIGTELSDWGNKNVHKLAFERWSKATPGHFDGAREPSRFAFAELKLSNPRRFDLGLEVAPMDKLRMPDFKLTPHEVEAITTVLLGLKDEAAYILPDARPQPNADQTVLEKGAFLVRQKNCYGCHKFDMDKVTATIEFGDGTLTKSFHGLVTLQDDDEEATYMQLWKADPDLAIEQGSGQVGEVAELLWENNADEAWPVEKGRGGGIMAGLAEYYVETGEVDDATEAFPLLPPILYREGEKVRAPWLTQFLLAPYTLRPWMVVRMPRFSLTEDEARAIALYFAALSRKEWDGRYTRALRLSEEMVLADFAAATGVDARILQAIESGGRYSANSFGKVVEYGTARSFSFAPPPDLPFEEIHERSPVYLAEKDAEIEGYLEKGGELIGPQGVNCYACHIRDGQAPGGDKLSWAPDLAYAKDRLRPDWILAWVTDAQKIYPGTKMPTALGLVEDPKLQEIMPGEPLQLLEAIRDYLLNSDRVRAVGDPLSMAAPGSGGR